LQTYIRNMMAVMAFDAQRRGRLISQDELNEYTHWLAVAVTEAMHYFIGHDDGSPRGEVRYLAVTGAHITHMLRDTLDDVHAGYFNIPVEFLKLHSIDPQDVESPAYRLWVQSRVNQARTCFESGRRYLARVENPRCRMAGFAYAARFEGVLSSIESDGYRLRSEYPECKSLSAGLKMSWSALSQAFMYHPHEDITQALPVR
jgi:phytoene/squalene synthetase